MDKGRIQRINRWMLRTSPNVVRKLEGDPEGILRVTRDNPLGFENGMKLLVPRGVEVYDPIDHNNQRGAERNVFFVTGISDQDTAYATPVYKKGGSLNYDRNIENLFDGPRRFYEPSDSALIFLRLSGGKHRNLLVGFGSRRLESSDVLRYLRIPSE